LKQVKSTKNSRSNLIYLNSVIKEHKNLFSKKSRESANLGETAETAESHKVNLPELDQGGKNLQS
jgi:hypothetical protein